MRAQKEVLSEAYLMPCVGASEVNNETELV